MLPFVVYFLLSTVYSTQVMGDLNAMPHDGKLFTSIVNATTTAVPPKNATTLSTNAHTSTTFITTSTMTPTSEKYETKTTFHTQSTILSKLASVTTSSIVPTFASDQESTVRQLFKTTTAAPPSVGPIPTYREFDGLSFAGGALVTIALVVVGTFAWKMYKFRVERSYWTL